MVNNELLKISLSAAVPLWIERLKEQPYEQLIKRAGECGQIIAEKGDMLMFKSSKRGETARAFNALAEALAILAFSPGGVTFVGLHFEAVHLGAL